MDDLWIDMRHGCDIGYGYDSLGTGMTGYGYNTGNGYGRQLDLDRTDGRLGFALIWRSGDMVDVDDRRDSAR